MEEKAHFSYEGNAELHQPRHQIPRGFSRVLEISNLQPVVVNWEDDSGQDWSQVFYLDFYKEMVYDSHTRLASGPLADAVLQILQEKKAVAQAPIFPEGFVENILSKQQQIIANRPNRPNA